MTYIIKTYTKYQYNLCYLYNRICFWKFLKIHIIYYNMDAIYTSCIQKMVKIYIKSFVFPILELFISHNYFIRFSLIIK